MYEGTLSDFKVGEVNPTVGVVYIICLKYSGEDNSNFPSSLKVMLVFIPSPQFCLKLMRNGVLKILMKNTADLVFLH